MSDATTDEFKPDDVTASEWDRLLKIPRMTQLSHLNYLFELGAGWQGQGVVVECGCWLGASAAAVALGLSRAGYDRPLYCFDRWTAVPTEVAKASARGIDVVDGQNLEPIFRSHVEPFYPQIETNRGKIEKATWNGAPIELFLIDAAKREPRFLKTMRIFGPSFIPGVTKIVFLDFDYYKRFEGEDRESFQCQQRLVESQPDSFKPLKSIDPIASFQYLKPADWGSDQEKKKSFLARLFG